MNKIKTAMLTILLLQLSSCSSLGHHIRVFAGNFKTKNPELVEFYEIGTKRAFILEKAGRPDFSMELLESKIEVYYLDSTAGNMFYCKNIGLRYSKETQKEEVILIEKVSGFGEDPQFRCNKKASERTASNNAISSFLTGVYLGMEQSPSYNPQPQRNFSSSGNGSNLSTFEAAPPSVRFVIYDQFGNKSGMTSYDSLTECENMITHREEVCISTQR